jgi:hypothetical protein
MPPPLRLFGIVRRGLCGYCEGQCLLLAALEHVGDGSHPNAGDFGIDVLLFAVFTIDVWSFPRCSHIGPHAL